MGSPVSPIVANLFMEDFEDKALTAFHSPPRYWGRYMDDTMTVLKSAVVDEFSEHLNNLHPAIKFTREMEDNNTIAMLDTRITRSDEGTLSFSVYRKPTHTDQYLQFSSHQPLQHKLGVIRTLSHRATTLCSTEEARNEEMEHLKEVLSVSGYQKWAWNLPGSNITRPRSSSMATTPSRGHVSMPYVQGVTEALSRRVRKLGVSVHPRPINTIRGKLVRPKDKTNKLDNSGVIYKIDCEDCPETYIGETKRNLRKRVNEHKRENSPVGAHMLENHHHFENAAVDVLDKEPGWFQRGIKEAIYIAAHNPSMNQDRGRHFLPSVYSSLVHSQNLNLG